MKKVFAAFLVGVIIISIISGRVLENKIDVGAWSKKLIRFHVIANSDSSEDQELKLKVRDAVLVELTPALEGVKTREQSEKVIRGNLENIKKLAEEIVKKEGKEYKVKVEYGVFSFPTRYYGAL
ncbi:MAG: stage II sporulation protein R, partial [Caldanaerobacter sp.]